MNIIGHNVDVRYPGEPPTSEEEEEHNAEPSEQNNDDASNQIASATIAQVSGEPTYTITISDNEEAWGSITVNPVKELYTNEDTVTLTATSKAGYEFDKWANDDSTVNTKTLIIPVPIEKPIIYVAVFKRINDELSTPETPESSETSTYEPTDTRVQIELSEDGHIVDYHLILPNQDWYNAMKECTAMTGMDIPFYYYYDTNEGKIVKVSVVSGDTTSYEISDFFVDDEGNINEDVIDRLDIAAHISFLPIDFDILHFFNLASFRKCYVRASYKALTENLNCKKDCDLKFKRDLLHMAYTVMMYQIELGHYDEAQALYEEFTKCGGLCKDINSKHYGCGCHKA